MTAPQTTTCPTCKGRVPVNFAFLFEGDRYCTHECRMKAVDQLAHEEDPELYCDQRDAGTLDLYLNDILNHSA